jgi:hypothetical protein
MEVIFWNYGSEQSTSTLSSGQVDVIYYTSVEDYHA